MVFAPLRATTVDPPTHTHTYTLYMDTVEILLVLTLQDQAHEQPGNPASAALRPYPLTTHCVAIWKSVNAIAHRSQSNIDYNRHGARRLRRHSKPSWALAPFHPSTVAGMCAHATFFANFGATEPTPLTAHKHDPRGITRAADVQATAPRSRTCLSSCRCGVSATEVALRQIDLC